jgi:hypothetical protein
VLDWVRRLRKVSQKLSLPSRDAAAGRSQIQLNPSKLTPSPEIYLGQLACLFDVTAELLEDEASLTSNPKYEKTQLEISKQYRSRHKILSTMVAKLGDDVVDLESIFEDRINLLMARTQGANYLENLMRLYVVVGMLEDSARKVAKGLSPARRLRVDEILSNHSLENFVKTTLAAEIEANPKVAGVLAMFGRAIVADALLEVRDSVNLDKLIKFEPGTEKVHRQREQFKVLEQYTSELISAHALRMDFLGLTA